MIKLFEEDVRRLVEAARESGLKIDEEARASVEPERSPEFYLGYLSGIMCAVTICRNFIGTLGTRMDQDSHKGAKDFTAEKLAVEPVELITMHTAGPAAVAAELYVEALSQLR